MRHTKDGRLVLSDSLMKVYQDCGARFWFTYLEKPEEMPRLPALELGTTIHSMFYDFFKRKNPDAKMYQSATNFANVFRGRWFNIDSQPKTDKGRRKPPILWKSEDEKEKLMGAGYRACHEFFQRNLEVPFSHVMVEHYFIINITNERNARGYALHGYIDRLELKDSSQPGGFEPEDLGKAIRTSNDGRLHVVDYKSGYKTMEKAALDLDTQFSCYDLAVELLYPFLPRTFAIEATRDGTQVPTTRGEGERRVLRERIFKIGRAIEREEYPMASNMYKCNSCLYVKHCGSLQKLAGEKGLHPEDLMRASSPFSRGARKQRSLFEWKDGEITGITDEKRLARAERLRLKPVQLSFFSAEEDLQEEEEAQESTGTFVEELSGEMPADPSNSIPAEFVGDESIAFEDAS